MKLAITFLLPLAFGLALGSLQAADHPATSAVTKVGLQKVIIVYKTHFDIGYTTMAREVVHGYRTEMADRVLDAIERNHNQPPDQQFVWTVSGWPMKRFSGTAVTRAPAEARTGHSRRSPGRPCVPVHHAHGDGGTGGPGARADHLLDPRSAVRAAALHGRENERRAGPVVDFPHAVHPCRHQVLPHGRPAGEQDAWFAADVLVGRPGRLAAAHALQQRLRKFADAAAQLAV